MACGARVQIARVWYSATGWQIRRGRREQSSDMSCQIIADGLPPPALGGLATLVWNGRVLFGGLLQQRAIQSTDPRQYQIQAVGLEKCLLRRTIRSFSGYDVSADGLITPGAASAIVTAAGADAYLRVAIRQIATPDPRALSIQGITGAQALSILADLFGYDWWVEPVLPADQDLIDLTQPLGQIILQSPDWPSPPPVDQIDLQHVCGHVQRIQTRLQARSITRVTVARTITDVMRDETTDPTTTVRRIQIVAGSEQREFPLLPTTDRIGGAAIET